MLKIARLHWEQMRAHVAAEAPLEACGLLAGVHGISRAVFPIQNELASPTHFRMQPNEQLKAFSEIERTGWQLLAIYHSHPAGPPRPSQTDVAEALFPGITHLIWSPQNGEWNCAAFLLDGEVKDVEWLFV
jgi:proteasome lid subunit RPN8/RPN11